MEKNNASEARGVRRGLSPAELQALGYWRLHHGRHWKADLWKAWDSHVYGDLPSDHPALLHGLRNRLGPRWLAGFKFPS